MFSIFDDEEELTYPMIRPLSPLLETEGRGVTYTVVSALSPVISGPSSRRRTVIEALERLATLPSPILPRGTPPGIVRLMRRPLGIYGMALLLAAGLIVIDPLDRLEGGLID